MNAYAERWVRSVKDECLSKLILFSYWFWLLSGQIEAMLIFAGLSVADLFPHWSRIGPILDGSVQIRRPRHHVPRRSAFGP